MFRQAPPKITSLVGRANVVDGDTIRIGGETIRFNGIDAPESDQLCTNASGKKYRCGAKSAEALQAMLRASSPTRCEFVEYDQYGRFVGNCFRADNSNVQELLVRSGWALDWPRYSSGRYVPFQETAKAERVGIWVGQFDLPWEYRKAARVEQVRLPKAQPLITDVASSGSCNIKGNISAKGERIYHVPGQQHYAKTKISPRKGERWFCSEAEAVAAGWRASRR